MPHSSELEEFGLEVEHEHDALMGDSGPGNASLEFGGPSTPSRRHHPLSFSTPSKEQRSLLQSVNVRTSRFKPGMLKWATLMLALAIVVFLHVGEESEETLYVEERLPEVDICQDDPEFHMMVKSEKDCRSFVADLGRQQGEGGLLEERCNTPIGIPDENEFQKLLKHFCRKSCGLCGTEDSEEGVSQAVIEAEVQEIAGEIEEKEIEEEIEKEMEEIEKEVEERKHEEEEQEEDISDEGEAVNSEEENKQSNGSAVDEESEGAMSVDKDTGSEVDGGEDDHSAEGTGVANKSVASDEKSKQTLTSDGKGESAARVDEDRGGDEEVAEVSDEPDDLEHVDTDKPSKETKQIIIDSDDDDETVESAHKAKEGGEKHPVRDSDTDKASTKANDGSFNMQRLEDTRAAAQDLVNSLEDYYSGKDQSKRMMLDAWLDPWEFDKPVNASLNRMDKLVDTMARALLTDDQDKFLIGTIGSSVAAGHDNCHYDSYENQLERTLGPVWKAAGMKLVCQNAGEGGGCGDDYRNQAYCIKQNVSPKIDIAHYSWTYFEEGDDVDKYAIRESLIRWTQMLPHQPPVHVLNVLWQPDRNGAKQEWELAEHYAKYGYNAFYMRSGHKNGGYDYDADEKKGIDRYAWGGIGDGYHNVTRYGQNEKDPDRKESLGVMMRNWHPGPLAFEFVSDTFSYVYAKAMLAALDMIEKYMKAGQDPKAIWNASKRKILLKKSLPEPKFCNPMYCVVDEVPGCLNYEKPTFGFWGAKVENPDDSLNPHRGELQNWEVWNEDNDVWYSVGKQDTAVFQNRDEKEQEICRHLDQCGGISATSPDNGSVVFRLPKMEVGLVVICGCCGKEVAEEMIMQNNYIEIAYNGAVLDRTTWDVWPNGKCVRLLKKFPTSGAAAMTPTGHAYLSIKALEGMWKKIAISHVITL